MLPTGHSGGRRVDLDQLIEGLTDAVVVVDDTGKIVLVNAKTEELFGYGRSELVGEPIELLLPDRLRRAHVEHRGRYLQEPRSRSMGIGLDLTGRRRNGDEVPVEIGLSAVQTDEGLLVASVITDVTERRRLEDELRQTQKLEAVGRLAGGIAHDFNNLLTVILGHAGFLLRQTKEGTELHADAAEIKDAGERAATLTRQLLIFSRSETPAAQVIDLNEHVRGIETMLGRLIGEDVDVVSRLAGGLWTVKVDPGQLGQLVTNLVLNARDAMPSGGQLTIETRNVELESEWSELPGGSYVCLTVSDSGEGMTEETQRRALEPFFTTKEPGKGTGLGLATVYGIVEKSGGALRLYSEVGKGTTIKIYLPRAEGEIDVPTFEEPVGMPQGTGLVLLVEDEQSVKSLVARMLSTLGYDVISSASVPEAIGLFELHQKEISVLLTDVVMPQLGGRELADRLLARQPELRVLFMSGYTEDTLLRRREISSRLAFLEKPFTHYQLAKALHDLLAGAAT
jgi:PAS domain S-box-containing protein